MMDIHPAEAGVTAIGTERLLGIPDICTMTGLCPVTASRLMKESGRAIRVHGRVFILESSFFTYMKELEVSEPCRLHQ